MRTWRTLLMASGLSLVLALSACPDDGTSETDTPDAAVDVLGDGVTDDPGGDDTTAETAGDTLADAGDEAPGDGVTPDAADGSNPDAPWQPRPLGDLGVLTSVIAVETGDAYAVGGPRVLRFNGESWATFGEPSDAALHGVWSDGAVVVVVGAGGTIARRSVHELTWSTETSGVDVDLYAIDGRSADDLWAVGDGATVLHFDGTGWSTAAAHGGTNLRAVWVDQDTAGQAGVFGVGTGGQLVLHEGSWYNKQIAKATATLHGVWGQGGAIWAVGTGATIAHKSAAGEPWKGQSTNDDKERDLYAIAGKDTDHVVAVGAGGALMEYDGSKWNVQGVSGPVHGADDLVGLSFAAGKHPRWLAVSAGGGGCRYDGQNWVDMSTRPTADVRDLASDGVRIWGVGTLGLLLAYSPASGWTSVPTGTQADLNAVGVDADGVVWAVGGAGTVLRWAAPGPVEAIEVPAFVDLLGVAAGDEVAIVGKGGTLLKKGVGADTFSLANSTTSVDLLAAAWGGDGALWIGGAFGTLLRSEAGAKPDTVASGVGADLNDLASTATGVVVAGDNGTVLQADATSVEIEWEEPGLFLYGVATSSTGTYAVGWNGTVLRRDGDGVYRHEETATSAVLEAVFSDAEGALAAGRQGVLLERTEVP